MDKITSDYLRIYITAYNVFLEKPYIGSGLKSFLFECSLINKFKEKKLGCSSHPHNMYLEILVSQGFIGISIFFTFIIILIKKSYVNFISSKINNKNKLIRIFFFLILIFELFPFRSYGSIFTTVNGSLFWYILAITSPCYYLKKKTNWLFYISPLKNLFYSVIDFFLVDYEWSYYFFLYNLLFY